MTADGSSSPEQETSETSDALWLRELFEFELCAQCHLDAPAHTVGPDPLGNRHAWCGIGIDPGFALMIARKNAEKGDSTRGADGSSQENLRRERFEAAIHARSEANYIPAVLAEWCTTHRTRLIADDPDRVTVGRRKVIAPLDAIGSAIELRQPPRAR